MDREHHCFVAGTELGLQWSDAHVAPYDGDGRSLDEVVRDHCETNDGHRALLPPPLTGTASATHRTDRKPRISNGVRRPGGLGRASGRGDGYEQGSGVQAVTAPETCLRDVPLVVEDLLIEAKQLVDAGAPTEVIEEILDQVDALREGRG